MITPQSQATQPVAHHKDWYTLGMVINDDTPLDTEEMLEERDQDRWELDSSSAADH
jgi:Family of unknown function (DUF6335)